MKVIVHLERRFSFFGNPTSSKIKEVLQDTPENRRKLATTAAEELDSPEEREEETNEILQILNERGEWSDDCRDLVVAEVEQ